LFSYIFTPAVPVITEVEMAVEFWELILQH